MRIIDEAGGRRTATAALRNTAPIIEALRKRLPDHGKVLEVASGTGQHAAAFAAAFPALTWTPSDIDPAQRASIAAWRQGSGLKNLTEALILDVSTRWAVKAGDTQVVLTINLLHLISDHDASQLFRGARMALADRGRMIVYGPFMRGSSYASEGDRAFDASLRAGDSLIGYKSVEAVCDMALAAGLTHATTDLMPANNLLLSFDVIPNTGQTT
ncbi:MAG: DUF938 domain-containing protein [Pseudomonadota bacterium]